MRKLKGALRFKSEGKRSTSTLPPICATQYCAMGQILVYVSTEQMWVTKKPTCQSICELTCIFILLSFDDHHQYAAG